MKPEVSGDGEPIKLLANSKHGGASFSILFLNSAGLDGAGFALEIRCKITRHIPDLKFGIEVVDLNIPMLIDTIA